MKPDRKVAAGGIAGALSMIVTWIVQEAAGISIPAHIAQSITVVIAFAVSWFTPNQPPAAPPQFPTTKVSTP